MLEGCPSDWFLSRLTWSADGTRCLAPQGLPRSRPRLLWLGRVRRKCPTHGFLLGRKREHSVCLVFQPFGGLPQGLVYLAWFGVLKGRRCTLDAWEPVRTKRGGFLLQHKRTAVLPCRQTPESPSDQEPLKKSCKPARPVNYASVGKSHPASTTPSCCPRPRKVSEESLTRLTGEGLPLCEAVRKEWRGG